MKVDIKPATEKDYEIMLTWRNDPEVMKGCYSQQNGQRITREEHLAWLKSRNKVCTG